MGNYKKGGYEKKYIVSKVSGKPIDPKADYFVLRLDADPHARIALQAYADSVKTVNTKLACDLARHLRKYIKRK